MSTSNTSFTYKFKEKPENTQNWYFHDCVPSPSCPSISISHFSLWFNLIENFPDLSIGIVHVLVDIIWRMTVSWLAGDFLCRLIKFLQCLMSYASNYILVALSIDRFGAIVQPMSFSKRARWLLFSSWIISAIFSLPQFFFYEVIEVQGRLQCWIEFDEQWHWQLYMTLVSIFLFFIPVTIIACCYGLIIKKIWNRGSRRCTTNDVFNISLHRESSRGVIPRAKVKIVKMTFLIVVGEYFIVEIYVYWDH